MELRGPGFFGLTKTDDPKAVLRKGMALANRRLQCLRPITEYQPKPDAKRVKDVLPGTRITIADASRASAAIHDALRQLGRVGTLAEPPGLASGCELIGIWLEHFDGADVPIIVRITTEGTATAQIADDHGTVEMPYADLSTALASGRGRIRRAPDLDPRQRVSQILTGALGIDGPTHDRVVFVRSASFRTRGWNWLQDQHITPDRLVLPGDDPADDDVAFIEPAKCPGLRIIRVRERGSLGEVARGFGVTRDDDDELTDYGRISGLFPLNSRVFYGVNPRSEQMRARKDMTKLDPTQTRNLHKAGGNPNPLEIFPVFLQPDDAPAEWAMYTQALRRAYLHTTIASQLPLPLHLASLADEYLLP